MGYKCCVPMCKSGYLSNKEKVSIFQIPATKIDLYNQLIKLPDRKLTLKDHVCEKHFVEEFIRRDDQWKNPLSRPRLTSDAVPTIFAGRRLRALKKLSKAIDNEKDSKQEAEKTAKIPLPVIASTSKCQPHVPELFKRIWLQQVMVNLPHSSWSMSCIWKTGNSFIIFLQTVLPNNDNIPFVHKKIVLERDLTFKLYIGFESVKQLDGISPSVPFKVSTVNELEFFIKAFHSLKLCQGGLSLGIFPYLQAKHVEVDVAADRWRSQNCETIVREGARCGPCRNIQTNLSSLITTGKINKQIKKGSGLSSMLKKAHRSMRSNEFRLKKRCLELEEQIKNLQERSQNLTKELIIAQLSKLNLPSLQKQLIEESIRIPECDSEGIQCFSEDWLLTCTVLSNCNPDAYGFMWKSGLFPLPSPDMVRKSGNAILAAKHPPEMTLNRDEADLVD